MPDQKDDANWDDLYARGLIPSHAETEEEFLKRIERSPSLDLHPSWIDASLITQQLFLFKIDWVPLFYTSKNLSFWEGAAAWIGAKPYIQLRPAFLSGSFLGYKRSEVLAHEAVHMARIAFKQPFFEEILAYQTSENRFRCYFGPLFQSPIESLLLIVTLLLPYLTGWLWLPISYIALLMTRLSICQWIFKRCLKAIPLQLMIFLTDKEIWMFSRSFHPLKFEKYLLNKGTFRDRFLLNLFYRLKL
jgi:hypothetical protein